MKLKIFDNKSIGDLQEKFSECFPGFRINFFKNKKAANKNSVVEGLLTIADISKMHNTGELEIHSAILLEGLSTILNHNLV